MDQHISSIQTRDGLGFFQAPILKDTNRIVHAFLTRLGGVSRPPFDSLNLGLNSEDGASSVRTNRKILARAFDLPDSALLTVRQVHGDRILTVDTSSAEDFAETQCDAIITDRPGIALGVLTADCVPILLFAPDCGAIAAIHVGWRGTALNLSEKAVAGVARRFGARPENLRAAIGPCIGPCCYEVDETVRSVFLQHGDLWEEWANPSAEGRWKLNLAKANMDLLRAAGLRDKNIVAIDLCTHCQRELFFSFRRDKGMTGRQISWIMLR
jgi:YfiH family protein